MGWATPSDFSGEDIFRQGLNWNCRTAKLVLTREYIEKNQLQLPYYMYYWHSAVSRVESDQGIIKINKSN